MAAEAPQLYFESRSATKALRTMRRRYPNDTEIRRLSARQLYRLVARFKETGSVADKRHDNVGRPRYSRSSENVQEVQHIIDETPEKSAREVVSDLTNVTNYSRVYRMLRFDLKYFPYSISVMQHLKESDIESRIEFARWMKDHLEIVNKMWFSDESHFYFNDIVNKRNCRFWGTEKPNFHYEKPLHDDKITVWVALSSAGVIGLFFFEEKGEIATVNSERYIQLLKKKFRPALRRIGINIENVWFQQDGATPHTAKHALAWLHETFGENFTSFKTEKKKNGLPTPQTSIRLTFSFGDTLRIRSTHLNQQLYKT